MEHKSSLLSSRKQELLRQGSRMNPVQTSLYYDFGNWAIRICKELESKIKSSETLRRLDW